MGLSELELLEVSPLVLAYLGDAVWDLYVRYDLVTASGVMGTVKQLHKLASLTVCADAQARMVGRLDFMLTPEERDLVRRARNTRPGHTPRSAGDREYRYSTGFEALLGYLFLAGKLDRLSEILHAAKELCVETQESHMEASCIDR